VAELYVQGREPLLTLYGMYRYMSVEADHGNLAKRAGAIQYVLETQVTHDQTTLELLLYQGYDARVQYARDALRVLQEYYLDLKERLERTRWYQQNKAANLPLVTTMMRRLFLQLANGDQPQLLDTLTLQALEVRNRQSVPPNRYKIMRIMMQVCAVVAGDHRPKWQVYDSARRGFEFRTQELKLPPALQSSLRPYTSGGAGTILTPMFVATFKERPTDQGTKFSVPQFRVV